MVRALVEASRDEVPDRVRHVVWLDELLVAVCP